jgi:hypothetical protein
MIMPNSHMMMVLQTSARDRETGEIVFDTVTAIGTEMAIERIRPAFKIRRKLFDFISSQYPLMFSRYSYPLTLTQLPSFQGQCTYWKTIVSGIITIKP